MKYFFISLAVLVLAASSPADSAGDRFAFPSAVVVMQWMGEKVIDDCSGCTGVRTKSGSRNPETVFGSGHKCLRGPAVSWEFAGSTSKGDIYLIVVERADKPERVTPVLFVGKPLTVISDAGLTLSLLPSRPTDK